MSVYMDYPIVKLPIPPGRTRSQGGTAYTTGASPNLINLPISYGSKHMTTVVTNCTGYDDFGTEPTFFITNTRLDQFTLSSFKIVFTPTAEGRITDFISVGV